MKYFVIEGWAKVMYTSNVSLIYSVAFYNKTKQTHT